VAAVFNNNGAGVKGDLRAVARAILTDPEAGTAPTAPLPGPSPVPIDIGPNIRVGGADEELPANQGHLREPVLFATTLLRALGAVVTDEPNLAGQGEAMGQRLFYPPSVFNYFSPFYRIPSNGVNAPEFQILNPTTALARINFVYRAVNNSLGSSVRVPIDHFEAMGTDVNLLLNAVSAALLRGQMTDQMRASILKALSSTTDRRQRARMALYLAATSSRFQVQR